MVDVRCKNCGKLLGKFNGVGEVKCPRASCNGKNIFDTRTGKVEYIPITHNLKNRTDSGGNTVG